MSDKDGDICRGQIMEGFEYYVGWICWFSGELLNNFKYSGFYEY